MDGKGDEITSGSSLAIELWLLLSRSKGVLSDDNSEFIMRLRAFKLIVLNGLAKLCAGSLATEMVGIQG